MAEWSTMRQTFRAELGRTLGPWLEALGMEAGGLWEGPVAARGPDTLVSPRFPAVQQ